MRKTKSQKRKGVKARKRQRLLQKQRRQRVIKTILLIFSSSWKTIVAVSVLVGIAAGVLSFSSRISVSPSLQLDPSDLFSTQFQVSNDGYLSIYNVQFTCRYNHIKTKTDIEWK